MVVAQTLSAAPVAAQGAGPVVWQAGAGASGEDTYQGAIDLPGQEAILSGTAVVSGAPLTVAGWLVDTTAQGWSGFDAVEIYTGPRETDGTLLAAATVGQQRPDVGQALANGTWSASGFSAQVPPAALHPGVDPLVVYGPTVSLNAPAFDERISDAASSTYTVTGSAADPHAGQQLGSGIDRVSVYLGGHPATFDGRYLGDAKLSGNDWSLTFKPSQYSLGYTTLSVYAHSQITEQQSITYRRIFIGRL